MAASRFRIDSQTLRPWLAGLLVLGGLIWGISWLLDTQQIEGATDAESQPTATTATAAAASAASGSNAAPVPLAYLLPLGPEDDGFRVNVRGTVVAAPIAEGFWILTDEDEVLFVRSTQSATEGQDLKLTGVLRQEAAAEGAAWAAQAKLREAAGWKVHRNLYLEADAPAGGAAAAPAVADSTKRDTT